MTAQPTTYQPRDLLVDPDTAQPSQVPVTPVAQPQPAQQQPATAGGYQPKNLLAGEDLTSPQAMPEGIIPQIKQLGVGGYVKEVGRELGGLPAGAAAEASRISHNIGGKHGLFGLLGYAYQKLPESFKKLAYTTETGPTGKAVTDLGAIIAASEVAAATGGLAIGPEVGVGLKLFAKPIARILGTTTATTAAADPGEKFSGALTGLAASVGGEVAAAAGKLFPEAAGKLASWFKKDESPLLVTPDKIREATARAKEAQEIGVKGLTAGALTRDPAIQAKEEMLSKLNTGDASALMRMSNEKINKQINVSAQKIVSSLGGDAKTEAAIGGDVQNTLRGTDTNARSKVSNIYDLAADAPGGNVLLPAKNVIDKFDDVNNDFVDVKFSPRVKKIIGTLKSQEKTGETLFASPVTGAPSKSLFSVKDANLLTKALNRSYRSASTPADKMAISTMSHAVHDTIDDAFAGQINPAAELFKIARTARKNLGDVMSQRDIVENIVRKKAEFTDYIAPEDVAKKIFSSSNTMANLKKVKNALNFSLDADGRKIPNLKGQRVWNNMRQFKLNQFLTDSTTNVNGKPVLSYAKLTRNFKNIGKDAMNEIFGDKEIATKFNKLLNVMDYWQNKAPGVVNYSNSANAIIRAANKLGLSNISKIPFIGPTLNAFKTMVEHTRDKEWVMKNLRLAKVLIKNPKLAEAVQPKTTNPLLEDTFAHHLVRSSIASLPMMGQDMGQDMGQQ